LRLAGGAKCNGYANGAKSAETLAALGLRCRCRVHRLGGSAVARGQATIDRGG
jgi:hypothetical protein